MVEKGHLKTTMKNENINRENLFDGMTDKYPRGTKKFFDWLEKYKEEVDWSYLFSEDITFSDLPVEMQKGIIHRFVREKFGTDMINFNVEGLKADFMKLIGKLEEHIIEKQG